jgi:hypothetical protein
VQLALSESAFPPSTCQNPFLNMSHVTQEGLCRQTGTYLRQAAT